MPLLPKKRRHILLSMAFGMLAMAAQVVSAAAECIPDQQHRGGVADPGY